MAGPAHLPYSYKILILVPLLYHVCGCGMENLLMRPMIVALSHMSVIFFFFYVLPVSFPNLIFIDFGSLWQHG